ncbi:MAG TPA: ATP-binding cassette domain-containing protein, partial [Alphaproteobacteria bacterium]|nr:ATP-binding cassette domain-containing protein [Alphaproteobacteria bacterium]
TLAGERGVRFSGGERQRIGIARALYHDPDVLVLDEATASLDSVTEKKFVQAIEALHGQKTMIIIAHRLSTVRGCDRLFFLDHGALVDSGTFEELCRKNNAFGEMAAHGHDLGREAK